MPLLQNFLQFIKTQQLFNKSNSLLLAVSGGIDSVVLCKLCSNAGFNFSIAHCNFNLRGEESSRDEIFVASIAKQYGVPYFVTSFDTIPIAKDQKKSIEETARDLRYHWFHQILAGNIMDADNRLPINTINCILTAHHADDNIETVLMNFFRGTGIKGLRGILPKNGKVIRPLLFAKKNELEAYILENNLSFVTDSSNQSVEYTRNFFRNNIIPQIVEYYPAAKENVLKNIQRFTDIDLLYQHTIALHKKKIVALKGNEVHIPILKLLKTIAVATILFEIIKDFGFTALQTEEVLSLLKSETGKYIQSTSHRIIKNRNWLIITPVKNELSVNILIEKSDSKIVFEQGDLEIKMTLANNQPLQTTNIVAQLDADKIAFPLLLRKWKQGDYFYPLGMEKQKKINRFLTDQKLSLSQKEQVWVMETDKKIVWIVGMRIDNRFKITPSTHTILTLTFKR